jgi:hypothetical protein
MPHSANSLERRRKENGTQQLERLAGDQESPTNSLGRKLKLLRSNPTLFNKAKYFDLRSESNRTPTTPNPAEEIKKYGPMQALARHEERVARREERRSPSQRRTRGLSNKTGARLLQRSRSAGGKKTRKNKTRKR